MKIYRVRVADHLLLRDVAAAAAAAPRAGRLIRSGQWPEPEQDFARDVPRPVHRFCATHDFTPLRELTARWPIELRAFISYPADGGTGWHTDSRDQGWRIYLPIVCGGFFMHRDREWTRLVPDRDGYANVFHVGPDWRENWHAVRAERPRVVVGLRLLSHPWDLPDPWTLIEP